MEQDERAPASMSFEVEVDAVALGVLAGAFRVCGQIAGHRHARCVNEKSVAEDRDSNGARNSSAPDQYMTQPIHRARPASATSSIINPTNRSSQRSVSWSCHV